MAARLRNPKGRGRPARGRDPVSAVRLPPQLANAIDERAARQDSIQTRSEAIRRLVELALATGPALPQRLSKDAPKASHMAEQEIDRLADPSATQEEQASRKRRLLKGPKEFRDMRRDHPAKRKQ